MTPNYAVNQLTGVLFFHHANLMHVEVFRYSVSSSVTWCDSMMKKIRMLRAYPTSATLAAKWLHAKLLGVTDRTWPFSVLARVVMIELAVKVFPSKRTKSI